MVSERLDQISGLKKSEFFVILLSICWIFLKLLVFIFIVELFRY